jgi:hypothetical protein
MSQLLGDIDEEAGPGSDVEDSGGLLQVEVSELDSTRLEAPLEIEIFPVMPIGRVWGDLGE